MTSGVCPYPFEPAGLAVDARYAGMREEGLSRVRLPYGGEAWVVTRYEDVRSVLCDRRLMRSLTVGKDVPRGTESIESESSIITMDPPMHSRLRRLVATAFTPKRVETLRPRIQQLTDGLIDRMIDQGPPVDLVHAFSIPLPITALCELLGVPGEDHAKVHAWTDTMTMISGDGSDHASIMNAQQSLWGYIAGLVAQRRETPTDDLIGALVRARDDEGRLTEGELIDLSGGILAVGHETTANHISNLLYTLLTHPDQLARLRDDPGLLPSAIEELLRFVPLGASTGFAHIANEDVEIAGRLVRAGEAVFADLEGANRDAAVFERPEELDLARPRNHHVGFGHGPHHCLGAQMARAELQIALGTLLTRFPDLELAMDAAEVPWQRGNRQRGPACLPLSWKTALPAQ
ncbi:cytochrome P450 [Amycolatopsis jiangsuensis]|uniref:Cytochrome P450 RapN n=1 Tax=Amycolatopsis jiangsuensis TaxID=1181879 RepID=A0A840IQN1_9PSEU|nr:cytochrome P450 [Amycolatopsis jiangsuensis]MBB4684133.1 cytochrome P450 RapN [Amycolatopsis jiangsuensis]